MATPTTAQTRIMIVDDSLTVQSVLTKAFTSDARFVVVAKFRNGRDALDGLAAAAPDVVLLDVEMPVMDGLSFLRAARGLTKAKICVLSSRTERDSSESTEARRLGADLVLPKIGTGDVGDSVDSFAPRLLSKLISLLEMDKGR